jgi:glycine cleavage system aminomethyltransferase T
VSLAFLTVAGALAESPLGDAARAAGATFEPRDGWLVATRFGARELEAAALGQSVGWADLSHLVKLELEGAQRAGVALEPGRAVRAQGAWWCAVTRERTLLIGGPGARALVKDAIELTTALGALALAGPLARELLARFCALDLRARVAPAGSFLAGSVARTPGYVLVEAPDRFLMLFGAAYGHYVWEVVADAGGHLGGRAVGVDALGASHA